MKAHVKPIKHTNRSTKHVETQHRFKPGIDIRFKLRLEQTRSGAMRVPVYALKKRVTLDLGHREAIVG